MMKCSKKLYKLLGIIIMGSLCFSLNAGTYIAFSNDTKVKIRVHLINPENSNPADVLLDSGTTSTYYAMAETTYYVSINGGEFRDLQKTIKAIADHTTTMHIGKNAGSIFVVTGN